MASGSNRTNRSRARLIGAAGVLIIALSAGAALLPLADGVPGVNVVGSLLLAAGIVELLAGTQRQAIRVHAMAAGAVTAVAGLILVLKPLTHFFPTLYLVAAWLILRALILLAATVRLGGSVRLYTFLSSATDLVLALIVLAGISIATLIVGIFGPTPEVIASFAWILAVSFVVNGLMLLETASCERSSDAS